TTEIVAVFPTRSGAPAHRARRIGDLLRFYCNVARPRAMCARRVSRRPTSANLSLTRCLLRRHARRDAPDHVADVIGNQQSAVPCERDAHGAPHRLAGGRHETGQDIERLAGRLSAVEWHEDHLVTAARLAVPGPVLTDEPSV